MIFTEPGIFGYSTEDWSDTYTLMAMVHGACVYAKADGQPDGDRVAAVYESVSEVPVTATIADVAIDGTSGQHARLSNVLPMPPDEAITDYTKWMTGARFVHDQLELRGWDVAISDAVKVRGLAPLAAKTDKIDAWVLAELLDGTSCPRSGYPCRSPPSLRPRSSRSWLGS